MRKLALFALSLFLFISTSGCSSENYYDLGFDIGSSGKFVENWNYSSKRGYSFESLCQDYFEEFKKETNSKNYALPTSADLDSLVEGCRAGFRASQP